MPHERSDGFYLAWVSMEDTGTLHSVKCCRSWMSAFVQVPYHQASMRPSSVQAQVPPPRSPSTGLRQDSQRGRQVGRWTCGAPSPTQQQQTEGSNQAAGGLVAASCWRARREAVQGSSNEGKGGKQQQRQQQQQPQPQRQQRPQSGGMVLLRFLGRLLHAMQCSTKYTSFSRARSSHVEYTATV
jgi:hypothetical protein